MIERKQTTPGIVKRIMTRNPWHAALAIFLLCLLVFLGVRASDEYRWSDWGFGDAQTMLSVKQWKEGGWFNNYFLFIPQGYAGVVRLLDSPDLRHHAHGTCPGSSPGVGPRLWYTHYPAGYLVPYALLFEAGLEGMAPARYLSIAFSLAALALMFVVFSKIAGPGVAFIASFFYGLSPTFLGYADSLANQPLDDLLRFAFMLAVVFSTRAADSTLRKRWMIAAWIIEFCLSLSSFDSVFFVYLWLIGWDVIERRGFRWQTYMLYALAPVSAHSLQLLQNVWYLGWDTALQDIKVTFFQKTGAVQGYGDYEGGRLGLIWFALTSVLENQLQPSYLILILFLFYGVYRLFLREKTETAAPSLALLLVFFVCGFGYIAVLPHAAQMPYQGRQMAPFVSALVGGVVYSSVDGFRRSLRGDPGGHARSRFMATGLPVYVFCALILMILFAFNFSMSDRSPVYPLPRTLPSQASPQRQGVLWAGYILRQDAEFAKTISTLHTKYEPVYFDIGGFQSMWDPNYVPGYPQINPIVEYYTGSRPVLCFNATQDTADDILRMVHAGSYRFSPVLIAQDPIAIKQVIAALGAQGGLLGEPTTVRALMNRYLLDLTPYLRWEKS